MRVCKLVSKAKARLLCFNRLSLDLFISIKAFVQRQESKSKFTRRRPSPRPLSQSERGNPQTVKYRAKGFLVTHRARMLASAHSVSENGAPAAGFLSPLQKARLIIDPLIVSGRRLAPFKRALYCFDNKVASEAHSAPAGVCRARLCLRGGYLRAANQPCRPQG